MKNRRAGVFIAGLLGAVILVGLLVGLLRQLASSVTLLPPDPQRHFDLQLTLEDVPKGYVQRYSIPVTYDEGTGRTFVFSGAGVEETWVNLVQNVVLFPSSATAQKYFTTEIADLERASLSDSFSPFEENLLAHADVAYTQCDRRIDTLTETTGKQWRSQFCVALAIYDDTLVYITGNIFPEKYMDLDSFGSVLRAVDAKFVSPILQVGQSQ